MKVKIHVPKIQSHMNNVQSKKEEQKWKLKPDLNHEFEDDGGLSKTWRMMFLDWSSEGHEETTWIWSTNLSPKLKTMDDESAGWGRTPEDDGRIWRLPPGRIWITMGRAMGRPSFFGFCCCGWGDSPTSYLKKRRAEETPLERTKHGSKLIPKFSAW